MEIHKLFAHNIVTLREKLNLSQERLIELTGLSATSISRIENGRIWAKPKTIDKIAKALNVDVSELFRNTDYVAPEPTPIEALAIIEKALKSTKG